MRFSLPRLRFFLAFASFAALVAPAGARPVAPKPQAAPVPWLYRGSDIPPDPAWVFGELPNGLRYAVRRNGVPPRQVSIRVAIDAGSLMERQGENGFAHFNEHLSFRGSKYVPDGEAKRVWQRLGATFGTDTNASTTPTQTIYKIDLPNATPEGLEDSVRILSGMMGAPEITQAEVDAERRTVLAELREGSGPQQRVADVTRQLFFAGQPLGDHAPIGDVKTLAAATPATLRAFHDRWYRPDRTLIVIAGDGDQTTYATLVERYFSDWKALAAPPADPDFGTPKVQDERTRVVVEPGVPTVVSLAVLRPWVPRADTIAFNRARLIDTLAVRMINRRLERRARAGGSFLQASVSQDDVSRSVDGTFVQIVPIGSDWQAAIRDVRGVIADALARLPAQDAIDREATEFTASLQIAVETSKTDAGGDLADTLVEAVNIRETVASAEVARDVFAGMQPQLTPSAILASTQKLFAGTPMRAMLTLPAADVRADAQLRQALESPAVAAPVESTAPVSFERLPKFGPAGKVTKRAASALGLDFIELSNGVRLVLFPSQAEAGKIDVAVRFGGGMKALPRHRPSVAWAAESTMVASGIGDLGQEELDRLTAARRLNMGFDIDDDAFVLRGVTRAADLDDELKLIAAKLLAPGWDPAPVNRVRAGTLTRLQTMDASPSAVLGRDLPGLLHGGDPRWVSPDRKQVEALTPARFRKLWEPLLATGPIEVSIYGDFDSDKAIAAAAATFGALPPRKSAHPTGARPRDLRASRTPLVRTHGGGADQAAAVLAWPTGGGLAEIYESRKLDILAAIFNDRLFDELREAEGASYSPNVSSQWPVGMSGGGSFVVLSQVKPAGVDNFFALARKTAAELASKPVSADELARSVGPMRQLIARASSGNSFWMSQLGGASFETKKLAALAALPGDYARITPEELQATAKRWLVPDKSFAMVVLPRGQ